MLDSFRELNKRVLAPQGRGLTEWLFLEVSLPQSIGQDPWPDRVLPVLLDPTSMAQVIQSSYQKLGDRQGNSFVSI